MIKILKNSFLILNKNLWLLFLFMTINYIGIVYFSFLFSNANSIPKLLIGIVTLIFIVIAGISGFFNTLKNTIDSFYEKKEVSNFDLLKSFPKGVAQYILPALGILILYFIITTVVFGFALQFGKHFIGLFSFDSQALLKAFGSVEELAEFQKMMTPDDIIRLTRWHLLYVLVSSVLTYLFLYWLPEVFYKTSNPVIALGSALKKSLVHPIITVKLFLAVILINLATSVIMAIMLPISFLMFLVYFVYFYGFLFILILMFNYFRVNFVLEKTPILVMGEPLQDEFDSKKEETPQPDEPDEDEEE